MYTCAYILICTYVEIIFVFMYACMYVCMCVLIYINTCIKIFIQLCVCVRTYVLTEVLPAPFFSKREALSAVGTQCLRNTGGSNNRKQATERSFWDTRCCCVSSDSRALLLKSFLGSRYVYPVCLSVLLLLQGKSKGTAKSPLPGHEALPHRALSCSVWPPAHYLREDC